MTDATPKRKSAIEVIVEAMLLGQRKFMPTKFFICPCMRCRQAKPLIACRLTVAAFKEPIIAPLCAWCWWMMNVKLRNLKLAAIVKFVERAANKVIEEQRAMIARAALTTTRLSMDMEETRARLKQLKPARGET